MDNDTAMGFVILLGLLGLYLLPTSVAAMRHHQNVLAIGALNILLGWSVLGWIAAFVWSLTSVVRPARAS